MLLKLISHEILEMTMRAIKHLVLALVSTVVVSSACLPGPIVAPDGSDDIVGGGGGGNTGGGGGGGNTGGGGGSNTGGGGGGTSDDVGAFCSANADCDTACLFGTDEEGNQTDFGYCTKPCESFTDCPTFWDCDEVGNAIGTFCIQD